MCVTAQCEWPMQRNPSPFIAGQQDFPDFQQPVKKRERQLDILDQGRMRCDSDPDWFLLFFLFLSRLVESISDLFATVDSMQYLHTP